MRMTLLLLLAAPTTLVAQQPPPACTAPIHRQLDFWIGEWVIADAAGKVMAESSITGAAGRCAVMEHWMPVGQPDGVSINWVEPGDGKWHQQWVGGEGWIAAFTGEFHDGVMSMVAAALRKTPQGEVLDKMTYQLQPDGAVHQTLYTSTDWGATWKGQPPIVYRRKQ
ncbi:MAG: hypothetical protein ABJC19_09095 [Gemmatimonadota bacterium]